ncbi:MAG: OmpA family protein [Bacteroidetes bacterium]|nr:OmpA family protein [Bacteroidota bacterium]
MRAALPMPRCVPNSRNAKKPSRICKTVSRPATKRWKTCATNSKMHSQATKTVISPVEVRNGKVYIAISDKMLFKSGSAAVEKLGKEALSKVATVLSKYPDMDLIIEGHTDNVPIKTERFADNWDLSVIRATSVVRILTVDYGLAANRVTPSGKGEFFPKVSNDTPEGRSKNRRTEIIIAPKLDEIEQMLGSDK